MSASTIDPLEELLRDAGEGWILDFFKDQQVNVLQGLYALLNRAHQFNVQRFGSSANKLDLPAIKALSQQNPHKAKAFLQALCSVRSPEMLVMTWRILLGMEVFSIQMEYRAQEKFEIEIVLKSPYGAPTDQLEAYQSNDIDDSVVLRHLGIMKVDEKPVFDGFYALSLK